MTQAMAGIREGVGLSALSIGTSMTYTYTEFPLDCGSFGPYCSSAVGKERLMHS